MHTSTGSAARCRPSGVRPSAISSAPVRCRAEMATSIAEGEGSSIARENASLIEYSERSGARRSCRQSSCRHDDSTGYMCTYETPL